MQFDVRALSPEHVMMLLSIDAHDEADVRRQVEARGLFVAHISPARKALFTSSRSVGRKKRFSLVLFSQELLALLNAGLSIVECLDALLEKESNSGHSALLTRILSSLKEGKRFSSALAEHPDTFPPLYIGIIKAAEGTSDLPRALSRFVDYQQRIDSVRSKIISASIYPVILMLVGGTVSFFLIGYVVPRFAQVYESAGRDLPWLSQLLLKWGQFAGAHTQSLLIFGLASLIALGLGLRHFMAQNRFTNLLSKFPGISERVRIYELSRLYMTLGMLLEGGIPVVSALATISSMVSPDMKMRLVAAKEIIESGTNFSTAFEMNRLTTPISLRMLRVGERSGELGPMLMQSASFYDGEIGRWIDRFTRTFEPLLMAAIGLVVGTIVVLLYMPIFDLAGSLS